MIELEIQGLAHSREGLLVEVGRCLLASGFSLQRQRLLRDPHGTLLTMVVRGPSRKRRALEAALEGCDQFASVKIWPFVAGEQRPHFAASIKRAPYVPPPAPAPLEAAVQAASTPVQVPMASSSTNEFMGAPLPLTAGSPPMAALQTVSTAPSQPDFDFLLPRSRVPTTPLSAQTELSPFVEVVDLGADEAAVDKALHSLEYDYPRIMPKLLALIASIPEGAREASLALAGRRAGGWVFAREYALDRELTLGDALERIGTPALRALVEVDQQGMQLHILASPLCAEQEHSGCSFFSSFLQGLLEPALASGSLLVFPVCCRSCGADECVLAISD